MGEVPICADANSKFLCHPLLEVDEPRHVVDQSPEDVVGAGHGRGPQQPVAEQEVDVHRAHLILIPQPLVPGQGDPEVRLPAVVVIQQALLDPLPRRQAVRQRLVPEGQPAVVRVDRAVGVRQLGPEPTGLSGPHLRPQLPGQIQPLLLG